MASFGRDGADVHAVQANFPLPARIQPRQQMDERAFAAAGLTHDAQAFSGPQIKGNAAQHIRAFLVREAYVAHGKVHGFPRQGHIPLPNILGNGQERVDPEDAGFGGLHLAEIVAKCLQRAIDEIRVHDDEVYGAHGKDADIPQPYADEERDGKGDPLHHGGGSPEIAVHQAGRQALPKALLHGVFELGTDIGGCVHGTD